MSAPKINQKRRTLEQLSLLIKFLMANKDLANNKLAGPCATEKYNNLWNQITKKLNAVGGPQKTAASWAQVWRDAKCVSLKKYRKAEKYRNGTGGRPPLTNNLNEIDFKVLEITGTTAVNDVEKEIEQNSTDDEIEDVQDTSQSTIEAPKNSKKRRTQEQLALLIEFLMDNKDLANNKLSGPCATEKYNKLWNQITQKLNAVGGPQKTAASWVQVWRDAKCASLKKHREVAKYRNRSGGRPPLTINLSEIDFKILEITGTAAVNDVEKEKEVGLNWTDDEKEDIQETSLPTIKAPKNSQKRRTQEQLSLLIEFLMDNKDLASNKLSGPCATEKYNKLWKEITQKLNTVGPQKSAASWVQVWRDAKCASLKKHREAAKNRNRTGGRPPLTTNLSEIDFKILELSDTATVIDDPMEDNQDTSQSTIEVLKSNPKRRTLEQLSLLIEFLMDNKDLANNKLSGPCAREKYHELWKQITHKLNAVGGPQKTAASWAQVWRDAKYVSLKKHREAAKYRNVTGGRPSITINLTEIDFKILELAGIATVNEDEYFDGPMEDEYFDGPMKDDQDSSQSTFEDPPDFLFTEKSKNICLKFLKAYDQDASHLSNEMAELMSSELNKINDVNYKPKIWLEKCRQWIQTTKQKYSESIEVNEFLNLTYDDKELIRHFKELHKFGRLTKQQLSCILDYVEITGDLSKLWKTVSLEMEFDSGFKKSEQYWKKAFDRSIEQVLIKQKLLNKSTCLEDNIQQFVSSNIINDLDKRLIQFVECNNYNLNWPLNDFDQYQCRICLASNADMTYIFDENASDPSVVHKLSECFNSVSTDDGYPQHICDKCMILLNNAYDFMMLCQKTNIEFKSNDKDLLKVENEVDLIFSNHLIDAAEKCMENESDNLCETIEFVEIKRESDDLKQAFDNDKIEVDNDDDYNKDDIDSDNNDGDGDVDDNDDDDYQESERSYEKRKTSKKEEPKTHLCDECGIEYKTALLLQHHRKSAHSINYYSCKICDKKFKSNCKLKSHAISHTDERPYICEVCGKRFKTINAANTHIAIHSTVKPFKCQHCPYRGATNANLSIHKRVHTGVQAYQCPYCPLKFSTSSNKQKHVRNIHQKEKSYKCNYCAREFFCKVGVEKHMVTHTGLKAFSCPECSIDYAYYIGFRKHMQRHHPGAPIPSEKSFSKKTTLI